MGIMIYKNETNHSHPENIDVPKIPIGYNADGRAAKNDSNWDDVTGGYDTMINKRLY